MTGPGSLDLSEGQTAVAALLAALLEVAGGAPGADPALLSLAWSPEAPEALPACAQITAAEGLGSVLAPLRRATPHLRWQQTYDPADGMGQAWLDTYAWAHLASPEGPFLAPHARVAIALWGAGQVYPAHAHAPEETYVILSGRARFEAEGRAPCAAGPGDRVHHAPWQSHSFAVGPAPLIVGTFWQGESLLAKSRLEARG